MSRKLNKFITPPLNPVYHMISLRATSHLQHLPTNTAPYLRTRLPVESTKETRNSRALFQLTVSISGIKRLPARVPWYRTYHNAEGIVLFIV